MVSQEFNLLFLLLLKLKRIYIVFTVAFPFIVKSPLSFAYLFAGFYYFLMDYTHCLYIKDINPLSYLWQYLVALPI